MKEYKKYLYDRFEFNEKYKNEVVELIRHNTNVEIGGYRLWDGQRTHLMQNPWELTDFIFSLKQHEIDTGKKISTFLEIGFASGLNNSILNKFFKFQHIVGLDLFSSNLNGSNLLANMMWKNLILIAGNTRSQRTIDLSKKLGPYDFIFIDADHTYEGVKFDFENYSPLLNDDGVVGFHDIDCPDWPGINKFWNELKKSNKYNMKEFICRDYALQYGIGFLTKK